MKIYSVISPFHRHRAFVFEFGPGKVQRVRARFTDWAATNVREHRWHQSQTIVKDRGDVLEVDFALSSTVEFKRWLLGFGPCAVVLKPKKLAREIAAELSEAADLYGSG